MIFVFLDDEVKEFVELVNVCFNKNADYKNFKLLDNQKVLLMKDNDIIVGGCLITTKHDPIKNEDSFYLDYLFVKEEYRGMGLGRKLFDEVESIARKEKMVSIQLTSNSKRETARKMYLNCQMEIVDTDLFVKRLD